MRAEEKILKVFEDIVKDGQGPIIEIGQLDENMGISAHNATIPSSMILMFDFLKEKRAKKVAGKVESGGAGDSAHTHEWTDDSEYIEPLKPGDKIAFCIISKTQVLILGRVV